MGFIFSPSQTRVMQFSVRKSRPFIILDLNCIISLIWEQHGDACEKYSMLQNYYLDNNELLKIRDRSMYFISSPRSSALFTPFHSTPSHSTHPPPLISPTLFWSEPSRISLETLYSNWKILTNRSAHTLVVQYFSNWCNLDDEKELDQVARSMCQTDWADCSSFVQRPHLAPVSVALYGRSFLNS